jgi:hypothetical protein
MYGESELRSRWGITLVEPDSSEGEGNDRSKYQLEGVRNPMSRS